MAIDVRQIGGIKANDSSDSALIAALDSRYGSSSGSSGGATVLPTFNPSNTVIFGSPGVSITPASTGSSTYNVQLGLPASLEAVTGGSGSLSPSSTPTLTFDNSSGIETVSSGNGGLTISLKSGQTTDYYVSLKLPTSLLVGGSSAVSVGTTLNKGSVTFSSVADSYGVFPESTSANTYNLNLVLPNGATVTGTGGSGSGGGGLQDITFNTVPAEYTASPATNAQVSIGGTGASRNVKLILPATASMSGGNGDVLPNNVLTFNSPTAVETTGSANIAIAHSTGDTYNIYATIPAATNTTTSTGSCIQFVDAGTVNTAATLNSKLTAGNGLYALKMTFSASGSNALCYGYWTKIEDNGIGILIAEDTATHLLDFRIAYILGGQFGGTSLFKVNQTDGNFQSVPWAHLGTMSLDTFRKGLQGSNAPEGLIPIDVNIAGTTYYTMLMKRSGAYGGLGINSNSKPFYMAFDSSNYFVADRLVTFNELTTNIAGAIVDCISNIINTWATGALNNTNGTYWLSGINTNASGYTQYKDYFVSQLSRVFSNTY